MRLAVEANREQLRLPHVELRPHRLVHPSREIAPLLLPHFGEEVIPVDRNGLIQRVARDGLHFLSVQHLGSDRGVPGRPYVQAHSLPLEHEGFVARIPSRTGVLMEQNLARRLPWASFRSA